MYLLVCMYILKLWWNVGSSVMKLRKSTCPTTTDRGRSNTALPTHSTPSIYCTYQYISAKCTGMRTRSIPYITRKHSTASHAEKTDHHFSLGRQTNKTRLTAIGNAHSTRSASAIIQSSLANRWYICLQRPGRNSKSLSLFSGELWSFWSCRVSSNLWRGERPCLIICIYCIQYGKFVRPI